MAAAPRGRGFASPEYPLCYGPIPWGTKTPKEQSTVSRRSNLLTGLAGIGLAACQGPLPIADMTRLVEPPLSRTHQQAPPNAAPGSCWGKDVTPAVIETVTEHIMLQPPEVTTDGRILEPALYKTESIQQIVKERKEIWFETPCEKVMDVEFLSSLQRALAARGLYRGPVTGRMGSATRHAVRRYQAPQGLDSSILSLAAARKLGLAAYPRPVPEG